MRANCWRITVSCGSDVDSSPCKTLITTLVCWTSSHHGESHSLSLRRGDGTAATSARQRRARLPIHTLVAKFPCASLCPPEVNGFGEPQSSLRRFFLSRNRKGSPIRGALLVMPKFGMTHAEISHIEFLITTCNSFGASFNSGSRSPTHSRRRELACHGSGRSRHIAVYPHRYRRLNIAARR